MRTIIINVARVPTQLHHRTLTKRRTYRCQVSEERHFDERPKQNILINSGLLASKVKSRNPENVHFLRLIRLFEET